MEPLRIGVLGAARINAWAIAAPAHLTGHRLVAIAARDPLRARSFADEHQVERVLDSYEEVIADPEVDVIYNPLPNGLHGAWNLRAIAAGKAVLCEKPSASNGEQARRVRDAARAAGVPFMEAFHYRYHPVMLRMMELASSGELGDLVSVEAKMSYPMTDRTDPRWNLQLAGGVTMDVACYAIHAHRTLGKYAGGEPRIMSATMRQEADVPGIDSSVDVELEYPNGTSGRFAATYLEEEMYFHLRVTGSRGHALAHNFCSSGFDDRITVTRNGIAHVERLGSRTSYTYQLEAFADFVRLGIPVPTDADDAVKQADFIDRCYAAAGLPLRPITAIRHS